eukprot:scaffold9972_cov118-Isochrysis_galbana.AAC.6
MEPSSPPSARKLPSGLKRAMPLEYGMAHKDIRAEWNASWSVSLSASPPIAVRRPMGRRFSFSSPVSVSSSGAPWGFSCFPIPIFHPTAANCFGSSPNERVKLHSPPASSPLALALPLVAATRYTRDSRRCTLYARSHTSHISHTRAAISHITYIIYMRTCAWRMVRSFYITPW